jgi:predicted transcriptional regulator
MSAQKKLTQEEKVLLAIFRTQKPADVQMIGRQLGLSDKSCRHAVQLLLHGNFITKVDENTMQITKHGHNLCLHLEAED